MISALSYYELGRLMEQFLPHVLVNHAFGLHQAVDMNEPRRVLTLQVQPGQPIQLPVPGLEPLNPEIRAAFKPGIQNLKEEVVKLQLRSTYDMIHGMLESLDKPEYTVRGFAEDASELHTLLVRELKWTTCFALWGADEELYGKPDRFGGTVTTRFAEVAYDVEEAAKCLALNRGTACVLHLLRVLEIALQELGRDLKLSKIDQNWENLLNDVDAAVRALPFKTDAEKEYRGHRAGAAAHLRNVKNAWRNKSVHPGKKYTPEEAEGVWIHTKALMQSLATFL